jgi:hypothetical protein
MNEQDARDRLLELVQEGMIDPEYVILAFVKWNTNDDIEAMCHANEIILFDEEESECTCCSGMTCEIEY